MDIRESLYPGTFLPAETFYFKVYEFLCRTQLERTRILCWIMWSIMASSFHLYRVQQQHLLLCLFNQQLLYFNRPTHNSLSLRDHGLILKALLKILCYPTEIKSALFPSKVHGVNVFDVCTQEESKGCLWTIFCMCFVMCVLQHVNSVLLLSGTCLRTWTLQIKNTYHVT